MSLAVTKRKAIRTSPYLFGLVLVVSTLFVGIFAYVGQDSSNVSAVTTVPTRMNFQGRLADSTGNIKANGTYNMKLRLYTVASAGTPVWTEDRLVSAGQGVTLTNGLFALQLGSVTSLPASLFASGALYLEVELPTPGTATSASPSWTEGAMTPRNQMATSAYAYNSELLDGQDGDYYTNASNMSTGTLAVNRGGTGLGTITTNGIVYGNGTSAAGVTGAGTSGQILQANVSGVPGFVTVSGDALMAAGGAITVNRMASQDIRTLAPSNGTASKLQFGFTSWANNNTAPYADYLLMRGYQDGTGGNDNLLLFRKDTFGLRQCQQTFGSATAFSSCKDIMLQGDSVSAASISATGAITGSSTVQGTRLISTIATGTAPLTVTSTTKVANLNVDLLDGLDSTAFLTSTTGVQLQAGTPGTAQTGNINISGTVIASGFSGSGSGLTNLSAGNLSSGTVNTARISGSYTGITGTGALAAGNIANGFGTISTGNLIETTGALQGGSLSVGNISVERVFTTSFPHGVANQKFDLYFPGWFWGNIDVSLTSTFANQNAAGAVNKKFFLGLSDAGVVYSNIGRYTETSGVAKDNFAISDVTWDAANSRWRVQVVHRTATGNSINVHVKALTGDGTSANIVRNNMAISSIYTTDTTVFTTPTVSFTDNVGIGVSDAGAYRLNVQGGDVNFSGNMAIGGTNVLTSARVLQNVTANANILTTGTLASARLTGSYTGITGTGALAAGSIASGFGTIVTGNTIQGSSLISTIATGTAPLTVTSTTKVANLNVDQLDGLDSTAFAAASGSANYIQNTTSPQTANFNIAGSGTINGSLVVNAGGFSSTTVTEYGVYGTELNLNSTGEMQVVSNGDMYFDTQGAGFAVYASQASLNVEYLDAANLLRVDSYNSRVTIANNAMNHDSRLHIEGRTTATGGSWTARSSPASSGLLGVAYGNGIYVGVGSAIVSSPDGVTWTSRTAPVSGGWDDVTFANGMFVAVGPFVDPIWSRDGINWSVASGAPYGANTLEWRAVTYGNGQFVATQVSGSGETLTSPDGINWTMRSSTVMTEGLDIVYANGLFVVAGGYDTLYTSPDGRTWTARNTGGDVKYWTSVTYGNGMFVAVANQGATHRIATSTDGISWTTRAAPQNNSWNSVSYGNGMFVAVSTNGTSRVMVSRDGVVWLSQNTPVQNGWYSVTYGKGKFVAVSQAATNNVMTSDDTALSSRGAVDVTGAISSSDGIMTSGNLLVNGDTLLRGSANTTNAFSVQNASGISILNTSTTDQLVTIGAASVMDVFTKLANPTPQPSSTTYETAFSPDGKYMASAHNLSPYITVYIRSGGQFTKLPDVYGSPTGDASGVAFSADSQYMSVAHTTSPYVTIYKISAGGFSKLSDPSTLPTGNGTGTTFSPDGQYMVVTHLTSPFVTIYKRSGDTFTKLANPASLPPTTASDAAFSPDGQYLSVSHNNSPYITIYKRSGDTFTKLANPGSLPVGNASSTTFSPDGTYMSVTHSSSPYISIYKRSGDTFTKLSTPSPQPPGTGYGSSFSPDGQYLSVAHGTSPYISIYKRSGDFFSRIATPADYPQGAAYGTSFSPDGQFLSVSHYLSPNVLVYRVGSGAVASLTVNGSISSTGILQGSGLNVTGVATVGGSMNVQGMLYASAGATVGDGLGEAAMHIQGSSSGSQRLSFTSDGATKWSMGAIGGGANPEFQIQRYSSAGAYLDTPFKIDSTNGYTYIKAAVSGGGVFTCMNSSSGMIVQGSACTYASSQRLKENIVSLDSSSLDILGQLRPVSFDWKADNAYTTADGGKADFGLIAEEVGLVLPHLVARDAQGNTTGVNYQGFIPFLIQAIKEQQSQISALQGGAFTSLLVNGPLEVKGKLIARDAEFTGTVTIDGHLVVKGEKPTVTVGQTLEGHSVITVDGTDNAGTISIESSANSAAGTIASVTFAKDMEGIHKVVASPTNEAASSIRTYIVKTSTGFKIMSKDPIIAGQQYTFDYIVIGAIGRE